MFEKEAEEYLFDRLDPKAINSVSEFSNKHIEEVIVSSFKDGAEYGYNKAMEEWKKCFLSCSSPFCSKHFPTVESSGVLGNMEKKEK